MILSIDFRVTQADNPAITWSNLAVKLRVDNLKTRQYHAKALHTVEPPLTTASLQRSRFWRTVHTLTLVDSCVNLSTTAAFFFPQCGRFGEVPLAVTPQNFIH